MKKRHYYVAILTMCSMALLVGCGKSNSKNHNSKNNNSYNNHSNYTPSTTPAQTTPASLEDAPTVNLNNLVITAGSEIDYMSAIESVENMDLSKSMVSINSSNVDRFTPGSYTVYYTFDYMGHTVKSFIVVTVLENIEETTLPAETTQEIQTQETSGTDSSEPDSSSSNENSGETSNGETSSENRTVSNGESASEFHTETASSDQNEENITSSANENGALNATVYHPDLPIPDAVFTLSTGEVVTIKNTPERYIVETFTDDVYYTEDGSSYLRSELKVLMNTGEVQTVEMVVTRVNAIPEESSPS